MTAIVCNSSFSTQFRMPLLMTFLSGILNWISSMIFTGISSCFIFPHMKKSHKLKSSDREGHKIGLPRPILRLEKEMSILVLRCRAQWGGAPSWRYSPIFTLLRWRHDFLPRFLSIETTETGKKTKKKRHVYLLFVTLWLFYALVNLTIFNFLHLLLLIKNIIFRSNCQQIWFWS
jgi:hypothetical protein